MSLESIAKNAELAEFREQVNHDVVNMRSMVTLIRTRCDALERVILGGRFSLIRCAILQLISPKAMADVVAMIHREEIEKFNKVQVQKARAEGKKITVVNPASVPATLLKPSLVAALLIVTLIGCVSPKVHRLKVDQARLEGQGELLQCDGQVQRLQTENALLKRDLDAKNERLRKFNQLDAFGRLRPANPCFDNPKKKGCEEKVTGRERWQK